MSVSLYLSIIILSLFFFVPLCSSACMSACLLVCLSVSHSPPARPISYKKYQPISPLFCHAVFRCPTLSPPIHGYFVNNKCNNVFNAACGLRCEHGYELRGSSLRMCRDDGTWSGTDATCISEYGLHLLYVSVKIYRVTSNFRTSWCD